MSRFRKIETKRKVPILNTSSLPDLIFTILFFFMLTSNMKDKPAKVRYELPVATQTEETLDDGTFLNIYIGEPMNSNEENREPAIQVNETRMDVSDLHHFIRNNYSQQKEVEVILRADKSTPMGLIVDIKKILQQEGLKKVQYIANLP